MKLKKQKTKQNNQKQACYDFVRASRISVIIRPFSSDV